MTVFRVLLVMFSKNSTGCGAGGGSQGVCAGIFWGGGGHTYVRLHVFFIGKH